MTEVYALQSLFEGLFVQALQPVGSFRERLRAEGFDLDHRLARYPAETWVRCVDVAVAERYPGLPRTEAWEQLGDVFVEGYFGTIIGRMISATLPFLSAKTFVLRSPRFITTGLENVGLVQTWETERRARLELRGSGDMAGHLMIGVSRNVFRRMKVHGVRLTARVLGPMDGELITELP